MPTNEPNQDQDLPWLLVVDDEPAALKIVKSILTRARYHVVSYDSAEKALEFLKENSADCIITDALMPGLNGYDFVKCLRLNSKLADLPILMLTRKRARKDIQLAVDAGVTDYVIKPINEDLLLSKVEHCVKNGSGKRYVFENDASHRAAAKVAFQCSVHSISEIEITTRLPFALSYLLECELQADVFHEIGIKAPLVKLLSCKRIAEPDSQSKTLCYEATFTFMGVPESDLKRIRTWLRKETIRKRRLVP
jgi:DNA-binding response OmpR family regulator